MTLAEWLALLQHRHHRAIDMGLERAEQVRRAMGLRLDMPLVVVGGTNGKGSVCALIDAAMNAAGFRCGCYLSPHLLRFNERVRIGGLDADDDRLLAAFDKTERAREAAGVSLTYFEFTTLAAAQCIVDAGCDCAVLEVGMGGRLDAVNLFDPAAAVVNTIGLDHCEFLGDTLESIAAEKAGIFRPNAAAIIGDAKAPPVLAKLANDAGADIAIIGRDFAAADAGGGLWHFRGRRRKLYSLPPPVFNGRHQLNNAAVAITALESLPDAFWPGAGAVRQSLRTARLPGRAQVLPGQPATVIDVAHNAESAAALEKFLFGMGYFPRTFAVFGMQARKDAKAAIDALRRRVDHWFLCRPEGGDGDMAKMAAIIKDGGGAATCCDSVRDAALRARAAAGENDRIVVAGSFLVVADFLTDGGEENRRH